MKIICSPEELTKGINIVSKAVASKTTMPILECILITVTDSEIKFTANNTELGIETIIQGEIIEPGSIAIKSKVLSEMVRKLPSGSVNIEVDSSLNISVTCEKTHFNFIGESGQDFTLLPKVEKEASFMLSQFSLKEGIRQTIFSISANDANPIMTGEYFEIKQDHLRIASLDGHRIAIRNLELNQTYDSASFIVPGKTLIEISKILAGEMDKDITIYYTQNHILFEFDETKVVSRLIEGEYFKIDQMIFSDYQTKVTVNKKDLLDCIDRGTLFVKENDKKPIRLEISDEKLDVMIKTLMGSMQDELEIEKTGKDITICFNPMFLLDALRVIDDEFVEIRFINSKSPCYICDNENNYIYLILPVNYN